jgi:hypothetical protein
MQGEGANGKNNYNNHQHFDCAPLKDFQLLYLSFYHFAHISSPNCVHYFHVQNSSDGQWNQVLSEYEHKHSDLSHDGARKRLHKVFDHLASNDLFRTKRVIKHLQRK